MYLDANFFIYAYNDKGKKGETARSILKKIVKGQTAITSSLALDEVMWVLIKNKQSNSVRPIIEDMFATENLEVKETPALASLRALDFIEGFNLQPRDAMHLATMEHFAVDNIVSDDSDFDKIPWIKRVKLN
ncbi:type II toxin-antitoxin system VapC family toxin [Nanoarchaeota archaeon]